ncbi:UDP-N-acetylmuramoyl-L-alanine--D-glutamate ligase [Novosphingobium sp. FSY-8]|uniref:UDP-N-acetylmuramoylalanine--D-glutamate ligase n=1 Tax=Novosphingobium ovatum TaxID=1908523 RepID=A0ABW9XE99_9SPHN|nr:UDP-N-acetylmuramoyl-L-alanine--D-glutamate ligase [Novosphingobium ovatum]NBC36844.1 UDP-N-acetylmuramoyl-L-alanine--D-glutamate ligase [Novosphingobium ovatum]
MITCGLFAGRRYAVLGLARSGQAAVAALLAGGAHVTAWDAREEPRAAILAAGPGDAGGVLELADPCAMDLTGFAGVVVSPGVPINRHPIADAARSANVPLICDIELFSQCRMALPDHRVVGITGTNGKSTTTALITHLLTQAGVPALMGGNIGLPILGQDPLPAGGVYVLELSSYQIDLTLRLDCDVAILLNLSPDHLDRYDGYEGYAASKARLFGMQAIGHLALVDYRAEMEDDIMRLAPDGQPFTFIDAIDLPGDQAQWPSLQGPHNRANAQAAVAAVRHLGLDDAVIEAGLKSFVGLKHRMERVAEVGGVAFVNDSKATNPASSAPALAAFPPRDGHKRVHWICGGLPKGDDLDDCAPWFGNVTAAYTIGDAGARFAELLSPYMPVSRSEMMCEAIRQAIDAAVPGDVVLLSPACASFDQFRDYEARGDAFRQIVEVLTSEEGADANCDALNATTAKGA